MSPESCLYDARWRQPVFAVADREYDWLDVVIAAMARGDWEPFARRLRHGLARQRAAAAAEAWPAGDRIDAAATEFRQARDLISRAETLAWLDARGIDLETWTAYFNRQLLLEDKEVDAPEIDSDGHGAVLVTPVDLAAEGFCTGAFDRFARALAGQVSVTAASAADPGTDADDRARRDAIRARHVEWLGEPAPGDMIAARLSAMLATERRYRAAACAAIVPVALTAQIAKHPIDWTRIDLTRLRFARIDAAHEARCCVQDDGLTFEMVAARAGAPLRDDRVLLEQLEPAWQSVVLSAAADELLGPIAVAGGFELATVAAKAPPDLSDAIVRARATRAVVEELESAAARDAVRWSFAHE